MSNFVCPCASCEIGEILCVECHFRLPMLNGDRCVKCYADSAYDGMDARFAARLNALGEAFGVKDAAARFEAEDNAEFEARFAVEPVAEWVDVRGRVWA